MTQTIFGALFVLTLIGPALAVVAGALWLCAKAPASMRSHAEHHAVPAR